MCRYVCGYVCMHACLSVDVCTCLRMYVMHARTFVRKHVCVWGRGCACVFAMYGNVFYCLVMLHRNTMQC